MNGQPHVASVPRLVAGQPVTATIRVTTQDGQKDIDVLANGSPYLHWQGAEASLSGTGTGQFPRMNQPGLMVTREQYALHAARFRLLEGEARLIADKELPSCPYLFTGDVGHYQGTVFQEFAPDGAVLVGLRYIPGGPRSGQSATGLSQQERATAGRGMGWGDGPVRWFGGCEGRIRDRGP